MTLNSPYARYVAPWLRPAPLLLLLCFAAYALRLFHLDAQSLWYDEGFSAWLSAQPLDQITARTAVDIHPPLYYYLLHFWIAFAGQSEFSLRFLSLAPGVLLVPFMYLLARRVLDTTTGWIAAILTALAPMYLWYSQEARMYMLLTLVTVIASYYFWRWTEQTSWKNWLLWTGFGVIAIYLHFYAFFILAFQAAYFFIWWVRQETRWGVLLLGSVGLALPVIAYLPWFNYVLTRLDADQSYFDGTLSAVEVVRKTVMLFKVGQSMLEVDAFVPTIAFGILALIGFFAISRLRRGNLQAADQNPFHLSMTASSATRWFVLLYLSLPFILLFVVSYARPKFNPRYLLIASPPFIILLSAALAVLALNFWRGTHKDMRQRLLSITYVGAAAALVLSVMFTAVYNLYFDPQFGKDDFRSVVATIKANRKPGEPTILVSGHMFPVYTYYDPTGTYIPLPDLPTLSTQRVLGYNVANDLNKALQGKPGAWVVLWQNDVVDPGNFTTTILDSQATRLPPPGAFFGVQLLHYQIPPGTVFSDRPQIQHEVAANYGNQIELLGYNLPAVASPADKGVNVTLYWRALADLTRDYQIGLRVLDTDGHFIGELNGRPATYNYPTTRWKKGDILFGNFVVPLSLGTPPGNYRVEVVIYGEDLANLNILDKAGSKVGQIANLTGITVARAAVQPAVDKLKISHPVKFTFTNTVDMLGFDLDRDHAEPGEAVNLTVYWRASATPREDLSVRFEIERGSGNDNSFVGDASVPLTVGARTTAWKQGDVIRAQYVVYIPTEVNAGDRPFRLNVLDRNDKRISAPVGLGNLHIDPSTRIFVPPPSVIIDIQRFGGLFQMYGYLVTPQPTLRSAVTGTTTIAAGQPINLKFYWRPVARTRTSYNVFVHLTRADSSVVAQQDGIPVGGTRPTTTWVPGEYIADTYNLATEPTTPPGTYYLEFGLYEPISGQRLTLQPNPPATLGPNFVRLGIQVVIR